MTQPEWPNHEHEQADRAARRRSLTALRKIVDDAETLTKRIQADTADGDDTQHIAQQVRDLTQQLAILGALREVRSWYAADKAQRRAAHNHTAACLEPCPIPNHWES